MPSNKGKFQPAGVGMTPSKTEFGSFIRARRLELEIRQVPLAQKAGLPQTLVSQIEVGGRKYLNDRQLNRLAKALQCDAEELRKHMPIKPVAQPTTEVGKFIRSRREELGLSLPAFAKKLKTTSQKAKLMELSKSPTIKYDRLQPLASALDLESSSLSRFVGMTRKETTSELGQLVRDRRKELGMSIRKLADRLNVTYQFVSQIELGQCRVSKNDELIGKLAQALELDVAELEAVRPERRMKQMQKEHINPLSGFLAAKRLELRLTQREVSERAEVGAAVVSGIETGRLRPSSNVLEKIAKVLDCQIPPELIPELHRRNGHKKEPGFTIERESPLGKFITTRRLELQLSQAQVAQRAETSRMMVSGIERGTYLPGKYALEKISKALECEIPAELYPVPRERKSRMGPRNLTDAPQSVMVHLLDQNLADLERIKELSDIRANTEAVRKALKLLRLLLEKQNDKHSICLRKDGNVVELEFFF
jgi:transcriptional regulator with XRE-family HTH domain